MSPSKTTDSLPDPVARAIDQLVEEVNQLRERTHTLEASQNVRNEPTVSKSGPETENESRKNPKIPEAP